MGKLPNENLQRKPSGRGLRKQKPTALALRFAQPAKRPVGRPTRLNRGARLHLLVMLIGHNLTVERLFRRGRTEIYPELVIPQCGPVKPRLCLC